MSTIRLHGDISRVTFLGIEPLSCTEEEIVVSLPTDRTLGFTRLVFDPTHPAPSWADGPLISVRSDMVTRRHAGITQPSLSQPIWVHWVARFCRSADTTLTTVTVAQGESPWATFCVHCSIVT